MDSIEITIIRTGAATAVAAKYLALPDAKVAHYLWLWKPGKNFFKSINESEKA